jgi:hypothetical protein
MLIEDDGDDKDMTLDDIQDAIEDIKDRVDNLEGDDDTDDTSFTDLKTSFDDYVKTVGDGESTEGRLGYIRQLTADTIEYILTLSKEINQHIEIPKSMDMLEKMMGRKERKRYYLSTLRL